VPSLQALATIPADHPCLWGAIQQAPEAAWVIEPHALLKPTRRMGYSGTEWWNARRQGAWKRNGEPIEALNDQRGGRSIYALGSASEAESEALARIDYADPGAKSVVLYGGSLFVHFGHLVLDLTRTYQLLRLFRHSKEPIWFHYPSSFYISRADGRALGPGIGQIEIPLILEWLGCLGLRKRARLIHRRLPAALLVSSSVLYRDRGFVSSDYPLATQAALAPRLRQQLREVEPVEGRIAYLSRHKLQGGTTRFVGEEQVVAAIADHPRIDVICPEELSIKEKLALYRRYRLIAGFPQACMNLKSFTPYHRVEELARQVMFIAGPKSLSSNWVNIERACGFGDLMLDCSLTGSFEAHGGSEAEAGFQRSNTFDPRLVVEALRELAG